MSQSSRPARSTTSPDPDRRFFNLVAVVLGIAVLVGFTLLPRLGRSRHFLIGKPAPDFALNVANADEPSRIQLANLRGKAVILSFWASWCEPCRLEAPALNNLAKRLSDENVAVVGVNTNDSEARAVAFARGMGLSYPIVVDDGTVAGAYGVKNLPTLVVIDKNGVVSAVRTGLTDEASLESLALNAR